MIYLVFNDAKKHSIFTNDVLAHLVACCRVAFCLSFCIYDKQIETIVGYGGLVVSTHVAIYTLSTLVEQTTPAMLEIVNAIASVSGTSFVDKVPSQRVMMVNPIWFHLLF